MPTARDAETRRSNWTAEFEQEGKSREVDADDIEARVSLAKSIRQAGEFELASAELEKILILDPDHILGLWMHVLQAIESHQFDLAKRDLDALLGHPGLIEYLRKNPDGINTFRYAIRDFLRNVEGEDAGKDDASKEARMIGYRALNVAINRKLDRGDLYYWLAEAYAIAGLDRPRFIEEAAEQLFCAFVANGEYINRYKTNESFNPVRAQIDRALENEMTRRGRSIPLSRIP